MLRAAGGHRCVRLQQSAMGVLVVYGEPVAPQGSVKDGGCHHGGKDQILRAAEEGGVLRLAQPDEEQLRANGTNSHLKDD